MNDPQRDAQRADHFEHLYNAASEGNCGHSGMPLAVCKASICDCFDFPWVKPDQAAADEHFGVERQP